VYASQGSVAAAKGMNRARLRPAAMAAISPSHLERKFVTLYYGSNLFRGERLWRMQVLEAGQSSRWC